MRLCQAYRRNRAAGRRNEKLLRFTHSATAEAGMRCTLPILTVRSNPWRAMSMLMPSLTDIRRLNRMSIERLVFGCTISCTHEGAGMPIKAYYTGARRENGAA
jgi:hypothetical protein